jgi:hypothetical protein
MIAYRHELRAVYDRLDLPQPLRARVLLELATDLAGLEAELLSAGLPPDEARARAVRTLVPSAEALHELREIHRPLYARLVDRFSDPTRHRIERVALVLASVTLFALGLLRLIGGGLLNEPAPMTVPVLGVTFAVVVVSVWKFFALTVKREHDLDALRCGLWILPVAAAAAAAMAIAGTALDLYSVAAGLEADLSGQVIVLVRWLRRDMGLLSAGLLTTLIALGMWLLLSAGVSRMEQAEADIAAGIGFDARP